MKSGVYIIKEKYIGLPESVTDDIWYCLVSLHESECLLERHYAKGMLARYYNEPKANSSEQTERVCAELDGDCA